MKSTITENLIQRWPYYIKICEAALKVVLKVIKLPKKRKKEKFIELRIKTCVYAHVRSAIICGQK